MLTKAYIFKIMMAAGILLAAILFYMYNPASEDFFPDCPFLLTTGFLCTGCGSQRALHQLLHGDIVAAMQFNVLLVMSVPILLYHQLYHLARLFNFGSLYNIMNSLTFTYVVFVFVMLYWILRNIPAEPFVYLAPH